MSSTTPTVGECRACGSSLLAGESLIVQPTNGGAQFLLHRVGVSSRCFFHAGRREIAAIAEYDRAAAIEYDHLYGGDVPTANARGRRETAEVARMFAANLAISARDARYQEEE